MGEELTVGVTLDHIAEVLGEGVIDIVGVVVAASLGMGVAVVKTIPNLF